MEEVKFCLKQVEDLRNGYEAGERELLSNRDQIVMQEKIIIDMRMQIKQLENRLRQQDCQLSILNGGPDDNGGPLLQAIRKHHTLLQDPVQLDMKKYLMKTADQFFDRPFQFYSSYLSLTKANKEAIVGAEAVKYYQ